MIADLIAAGLLRETVTEGKRTWILSAPIRVVVKAAILRELQRMYKPGEEIGGILYAYPDKAGALIVRGVRELPNTLPFPDRKTAYRPANSNAETVAALNAGALPIRFHSHPVSILESVYDKQPLNFFQKTSSADRHNSYLPLNVGGYRLVLPDGLLSADDREGKDVRFYLYGGLVAPDSAKALLTSEKVYIYFALIAAFIAYLRRGAKQSLSVLVLAAVLSIAVFVLEKRPTGVKNSDGDLVISIP